MRAAAARAGRRAPALRLPAARHPAGAGGHAHEPQEALPAVPRGGAGGAPPTWPQAGDRHAGALALPQAPNQRWSLDFVSDCLAGAGGSGSWSIVDDFTRECLAAVADTLDLRDTASRASSIGSIARRGPPAMIVSDNGPELTSRAVLAGPTGPASTGITSRPASRSRTPSSRASSAGCATSC